MVSQETPAALENGFIEEMTKLLEAKKTPVDVTTIVKKYLESSTLLKLNLALRFCCSIGTNRPSIVPTDGGKKYTLMSR